MMLEVLNKKSASEIFPYSYRLLEIQISVCCGVFYYKITGLIFFFFFTFLRLCIPSLYMIIRTMFIIQHLSKQRKMGCCDSRNSQPLIIIRKKYGILEINNHFLSKIQAEYLQKKRSESEASMLNHSQNILRQRMSEIKKKQQIAEGRFEEPLRIARSNPQKARQSELRCNMTIEQIIGLQGIRRRFEQLKGIVTKNVKQAQKQMVEDIRMRFQLMQSKLKEKIINIELVEVNETELRQVQADFKKNRGQQIRIYQNQMDEQIKKRISFDNYTKRFINIVPHEQLMTLTAQNHLPEAIRNEFEEPNISQNQICCMCI